MARSSIESNESSILRPRLPEGPAVGDSARSTEFPGLSQRFDCLNGGAGERDVGCLPPSYRQCRFIASRTGGPAADNFSRCSKRRIPDIGECSPFIQFFDPEPDMSSDSSSDEGVCMEISNADITVSVLNRNAQYDWFARVRVKTRQQQRFRQFPSLVKYLLPETCDRRSRPTLEPAFAAKHEESIGSM